MRRAASWRRRSACRAWRSTASRRGATRTTTSRAFVHTYCVVWDGPVEFSDGEVVEARWVGMAELRRRVSTDRFVPDSLAIATPLLHLDV